MRIEKDIFFLISGVLLCDPNSPLVQLLSDLVLERGRHSPTPINLQTQEKLSSLRLPKQQVQFQTCFFTKNSGSQSEFFI